LLVLIIIYLICDSKYRKQYFKILKKLNNFFNHKLISVQKFENSDVKW